MTLVSALVQLSKYLLMSSSIRLASSADIDVLLELLGEFYAESSFDLDLLAARAALEQLIQGQSIGRVWLVLSDDEPVGYIALTLGFAMEYYGRDAFVDDLFIRPEHRAKGLGTLAMDTLEDTCRVLGVRAIHLEVGRGNEAAQALYRKRGFEDNDRQLLTKRLWSPEGALEE